MNFRTPAALGLVLGLVLAPAVSPAAGPTCHCFRDRDYDPANPDKSDEYLLATASNTLLSAAYGAPKREIVQALMSGTPGADLWISHYAAQRQGVGAAVLLQERAGAPSWREVFQSRGGQLEALGARFVAALAAGTGGADAAAMAWVAAAETLAARVGTPWPELDDLAARGASLQETVLAALIAAWSSQAAPQVYSDVKTGTSGWSRQLAAQGKVPKSMETYVAALLARQRSGPTSPPR